jgi:hypothetical protein
MLERRPPSLFFCSYGASWLAAALAEEAAGRESDTMKTPRPAFAPLRRGRQSKAARTSSL